MLERYAWPWIPLMSLVFCWIEPTFCSAQSSPSEPSTVNSVATPEGPASSVSPAIERFMKQKGRDLPPPVASASSGGAGLPTSAFTQGLKPSEGHDVAQLPAPLPGPTTPTSSTIGGPLTTGEIKLKPAPLSPQDMRFPINLATALRLSDARPLVVAAAQASVWVAEADLTRAKVLWVPTLNFAVDYIRHDGGGPDFNKGVMTTPASVNFFYGGAGLTQYVNLTDAIFQPLVARQVLNSRQWDVQTSKNDVLLQAANAYFSVHQARGTYAGNLYTVGRGRDLVQRIDQLSRELIPRYEVDRVRNVVADLEQRAATSRQEWRVESANLTQVLRLDPRAVVEPLEHDHAQVTLIDPGRGLDDLMPIALTNRPELASQKALLEAAGTAIRREKSRPLLPSVILGGFQSPGQVIQGGVFVLGPNSSLNQTVGRADVSLQLIWQLENMGIGNMARIKTQRGKESQALVDLRKTQDRVVADVYKALARVQAAAPRVLQADRALRTAIITFNGHFEGMGQTRRLGNVLVLAFRPQEAVYSLVQMNVSFNEYFTTVAEYNKAQFELFHALGYPAREVASLRTPGEVVPVNTARPNYLPPVGKGPPPATR
jgi:outer membrane protein TolC